MSTSPPSQPENGNEKEPAGEKAEKPRALKDRERITFQFCRECSNMLYPKEDGENQRLMYACRTCQFSEPAASACVFRNDLSNAVGETAGVTQDVGLDPTVRLPVPGLCMLCGQDIPCDICDLGLSGVHYWDTSEEEEEHEEDAEDGTWQRYLEPRAPGTMA